MSIIFAFLLVSKCLAHVCQTPANPSLQSPSCNEKWKEQLPTEQCCPLCCQNSIGICEDCDINKCLNDQSPSMPWSHAYTSKEKKSMMLVLQRPQIWDVPQYCTCGDQMKSKLIHLSGEPLFEKGPFSDPYEENLSHLRQKMRESHGCCTPPSGHDWYTRNLLCEFSESCELNQVKLVSSSLREEIVPISVLDTIGDEQITDEGKIMKNNALICIPRYDRELTNDHRSNHHLKSWLEHHAIHDFGQVLIYSGDCLEQVLTPKVLKSQTPIVESNPRFNINIVDISTSKDIPGWYHHQMLAIKDCWARGVASEASWVASIDIDEFLVLPQGWTSSSFFATSYNPNQVNNMVGLYKQSVSFGSINACTKIIPSIGWCESTWKGHRKYIIRATPSITLPPETSKDDVENIRVNLLKPPAFIHGDPDEYRLSTQSGMFVLHFSRCAVRNRDELDYQAWLKNDVIIGSGLSLANLADLELNNQTSSTIDLHSCPIKTWSYG